MGFFQDLAARAPGNFPGIDWAGLVAQAGSLEKVISSAAYMAELRKAQEAATQAILDVGVNPYLKPEDYENDFYSVQKTLLVRVGSIQSALSSGASVFANPAEIPAPEFRNFLTGILATLQKAEHAHETFIIQQIGLTAKEIADHADMVARGYRAFLWLYQNGMLNGLKVNWGTKGFNTSLGLPQAVMIVIAIGAVVAVIAIAYFVTTNAELARKNALLEKACLEMIKQKGPEASAFCTAAGKPDKGLTDIPRQILDSVVTPIITTTLIVGAVAVALYFLPQIISKVAESKSRWK